MANTLCTLYISKLFQTFGNYFEALDEFIGATIGDEARQLYKIIIDDPAAVAQHMHAGMAAVKQYRRDSGDAYYFNWTLKINEEFQRPFSPTHENVAALNLHPDQPKERLAADLRRAFSAIVAGNVKDEGIRQIRKNGVFTIHGEQSLMKRLDELLRAFVEQGRMKLPGSVYNPCYKVITD